jgi:hypothetical protein
VLIASLCLPPTALSSENTADKQTLLYVSPQGSNSNPGTVDAPFQTVHKAIDAATAAMRQWQTEDVTISLRGGIYRLDRPLTFGPASSGANGHKLVLQSYPGEHAVISGGVPITGWRLYDHQKNIYRAYVSPAWSFRQLYVKGRHATRARLVLESDALRRTSRGFVTDTAMPKGWGNITAGEVVILGNWMSIRCRVDSAAGTLVTLSEPCWGNSHWALRWGAKTPRWIENKYRLLQVPGEWYLGRAPASFLYYVAGRHEDMSRAEVTAPLLEELIIGDRAHDITFKDLTFSDSTWVGPDRDDGYVGLQEGYNKVGKTGALVAMHSTTRFSRSRNITFEGNRFERLGSTALSFDQGSQNIAIVGNTFIEIAGGAMSLGDIEDGSDLDPATQSRSYLVARNLIRETGFDYFETAAIAAFHVVDFRAEHNEIGPVPQSGISVGWGWGKDPSYNRGIRIGWNFIHDASQMFTDSAAIYTLGPSPDTVIHDNYISGGGRGYGCLYPDEGSAYQRWTHNVCENVREWLHIWTDSIHDNQIDDNWSDTPSMRNRGTANDVRNNTVVPDRNWPLAAQSIKTEAGSR